MADIEVPSTSGYIVNVVLNLFSALTAIVFNSITIQAMRKTSSLPNPLKILLLSLAFSDLAVGVVAQPLWIVTLSREEDTEVLWTRRAGACREVALCRPLLFEIVQRKCDTVIYDSLY